MSARKKSFTGKLKSTYSELFFSAEKHAGNLKTLTAAQRAGIYTSVLNILYQHCVEVHLQDIYI